MRTLCSLDSGGDGFKRHPKFAGATDVLFPGGVKTGRQSTLCSKHLSRHGEHILLPILTVLQERWAPLVSTNSVPCNENCGSGKLTWQVVHRHLIAKQGLFQQVRRHVDNLLIRLGCEQVPDVELIDGRDADLVVKSLKNVLLRCEDLLKQKKEVEHVCKR